MEKITGMAFKPAQGLTLQQERDMHAGVEAMVAFWTAAKRHPSYLEPNLRPHGRCIYSALSVMEILRRTGHPNAKVERLGLDVRMRSEHKVEQILTIGHPHAPKADYLIPAHLVVTNGDILIDPSIAQTKRPWNNMPHFAALLRSAPKGHTIDLFDLDEDNEAKSVAVYVFEERNRVFQISYFKLTRPMDLRTRSWRAAPDAYPERRAAVVDMAVELLSANAPAALMAA